MSGHVDSIQVAKFRDITKTMGEAWHTCNCYLKHTSDFSETTAKASDLLKTRHASMQNMTGKIGTFGVLDGQAGSLAHDFLQLMSKEVC